MEWSAELQSGESMTYGLVMAHASIGPEGGHPAHG